MPTDRSLLIVISCLLAAGSHATLAHANVTRSTTHQLGRRAADMELAEAESAALAVRRATSRAGLGVAGVGQPRDPVTEWEERVQEQFAALRKFASSRGCTLKQADLPPEMTSIKPGREITAFHDPGSYRVWKSTFPGECGFGQFGYYTPAGYLRRLRLSNIVFGDDVEFVGIWSRPGGLGIVTSQAYIQPHPVRFIPTADEIEIFLTGLGFTWNDTSMTWHRDDGVELADTHDRNFIIAPDGIIRAIDVQPRLKPGFDFDSVKKPA